MANNDKAPKDIISEQKALANTVKKTEGVKNNQNLDMLNTLQNAVIYDKKSQNKEEKKVYKFNKLKMYFGDDYEVVPHIKISMPKVGQIIDYGEEDFYHALSPFLYNSTSIRLALWESGVDWCKVKDIEVFNILIAPLMLEDKTLGKDTNKEILGLFFKDITFDDMTLCNFQENKEDEPQLALFSQSQQLIIKENEYMAIAEYIREILNAHPRVEKAKGKTAKKWMIDEDRMNQSQKKEKNNYVFLNMLSGCLNHPGFSFTIEEVRDMGLYQFFDSAKRLQVYEQCHALLSGRFSGFADMSKINQEEFNFFRNIYD